MDGKFYEKIKNLSPQDQEEVLWKSLAKEQETIFYTAKGLAFTFSIRGGEVFVDRKEKSLTASTVFMAYHKAVQMEGKVSGPKKLGTFGASYLYPVFVKLGVIESPQK